MRPVKYRMKTNRFQNGSFEKAKETTVGQRRPAVAATGRGRENSPAQCATPARRAGLRRAAAGKSVTIITAKVDVGFGNSLSVRGEGQGLSWDLGQPMTCTDGSTWVWSGRAASEPVKFKLLINDQLWCRGQDLEVAAGRQIVVVPAF